MFANWMTLLCIRNSQIFPVYMYMDTDNRQIRVTVPSPVYKYQVYFERQYKLINKNKIKRQQCIHVHVHFEFKMIPNQQKMKNLK